MRDLQRRLGTAGFPPTGAEVGAFCVSTEHTLREFQRVRHLPVTGECDEVTWTALVEASYRLGDRLLKLTSPHTRGDDVAQLQARLGRLGFDCGKVDGIYGPQTDRALQRFQRDCGLAPDAVCGAETIRLLDGFLRQSGEGPGVAALRERERFERSTRTLEGRRVVLGQFGGASTITRTAARLLRPAGALVVQLDEADARAQAQTSNEFEADLYVGLTLTDEPGFMVAYYAVPGFESAAGRTMAQQLAAALASRRVAPHTDVIGLRHPVLRETRMPAVLVTCGPVRPVMDCASQLASAVADAITGWCLHISMST